VRSRIGLSGQYAAVDEHLTGFENLDMVGRLYGLGRTRSRARARELLERFSLDDAGNRPSKTYSGGMRRRLDLAAALVAEPPVLVLDEPTTGLDVRARQEMWDVIRELVTSGSTLLLTTQYLEEADLLADDIIVIDHGQAIAHGTADQLKSQVGGERVEFVIGEEADAQAAFAALASVATSEVQRSNGGKKLSARVNTGQQALGEVLTRLQSAGVEALDIGLRRPTLDDVFLELTGHMAEQSQDDAQPGRELVGSKEGS
jgi:ABC-2 type transport system ATP-binding protein